MSDETPDETPEEPTPLFGEVSDAPMPDASDVIPDHTATKQRRRFGSRAKTEPTPRPTRRKSPAIPRRKGQFVQPLTNLYASIGIMLMPFDAVCGKAVIDSAENCAKSLDDLAYQNEAVRRVVHALIQTSTVGAVIAAHAPILMAIAMHHVPSIQNAMGSLGQVMAENVEAQMRAAQPPPTTGESDAA